MKTKKQIMDRIKEVRKIRDTYLGWSCEAKKRSEKKVWDNRYMELVEEELVLSWCLK